MGKKASNPRSGSMQFWPRVRAKKVVPRVKSQVVVKDSSLSGFAGYKVGMTHVFYHEDKKGQRFFGEDVNVPATVIECPPIKIYAIRLYNKDAYGMHVAKDVVNPKLDKEVSRVMPLPKKQHKVEDISLEGIADVRVLVYTQPKLTGIGQKKPHVFEMALSGNVEEKLNFAKENLEKEIPVSDVLKEGQFVDVWGVTKGKGYAGVIKRFGVARKQAKSEKGTRRVGSICGGWKAQGHMMYRVPQAGKMGYHNRLQYNLKVLKISDEVEAINPVGGFLKYGLVKNTYVLLKGSIPGSKKRIVRMQHASRPDPKASTAKRDITYVSQVSQQ